MITDWATTARNVATNLEPYLEIIHFLYHIQLVCVSGTGRGFPELKVQKSVTVCISFAGARF